MSKVKTQSTLESGKEYSAEFRNGKSGLLGLEWAWDSEIGEHRPWIACTWKARHAGTSVGPDSGTPNADHGKVTITLDDGTQHTGSYSAGDRSMCITID